MNKAFVAVRLPATDGRVNETLGFIDTERPFYNTFGPYWNLYFVHKPSDGRAMVCTSSVSQRDVVPVSPSRIGWYDRMRIALFIRRNRIKMNSAT